MDIIKTIRDHRQAIKWLFLGDSILQGALHTFGGRDASELFRERVRWELRRSKDMVLNLAFSGHTSADICNIWPEAVAAYRPDVTFLMIGTNDCVNGIAPAEYSRNLQKILTGLRRRKSEVIFLTPFLPTSHSEYGKNLPPYIEEMRLKAKQKQVFLIDIYSSCQNNPQHQYGLSDAIHPNAEGQRMIAFTIFKALGIFDQEHSMTCRLFVP